MAAEGWYIEVRDPQLDTPTLRRAVGLELREVEVHGAPQKSSTGTDEVSLYIRVARREGVLFVSLWDRGEFAGRRRVSDSQHARILSRRVGLAVGELARNLSVKRKREAQLLARREAILRQEVLKEEESAQGRTLGLRSGLSTLVFPQGAWLIGPALGVEFNNYTPLRFTTEVSFALGKLPALSNSLEKNAAPPWSTFDFVGGVDYLFRKKSPVTFSLGGVLALSALHVGGGAQVQSFANEVDALSVRAGLRLATSRQFAAGIRAQIELRAGAVLHPVPLTHLHRDLLLGGPFIGLSVLSVLQNGAIR